MDKFSETRMIQNDEPTKRKRGRPRINPLPEETAPPVPKGIRCPACGSNNNYVYRSVPASGGLYTRERVCQDCRRQFETTETPKS